MAALENIYLVPLGIKSSFQLIYSFLVLLFIIYSYKSEGVEGFCYPMHITGTIPLYRYWNSKVVNHFYTTSITEIGTATPGTVGKHGYVSEGVACYVFPARC